MEQIIVEPTKFTPATNADAILFRSSQVYKLFTEPKLKTDKEAGNLSEAAKEYCLEAYLKAVYGRIPEEIKSKYLDKGNAREEDSITLLSLINKRLYKKNDERLNNQFITGEPDVFIGENVRNADETLDTKSMWSLYTFYEAKQEKLKKAYEYQGHSYMALTGAKQHTVAHCLVNGTAEIINSEKQRLAWKMGVIDIEASDNEDFFKKCRQIEINHIFDMKAFYKENPNFHFHNDLNFWNYDIPMQSRIHSVVFERNEEIIATIYVAASKARKFINKELFKI